jgi:hypothetical protein
VMPVRSDRKKTVRRSGMVTSPTIRHDHARRRAVPRRAPPGGGTP